MIPIYKPYISKFKTSALEAIESEWISNHGIYVSLATEKLKSVLGVPYCILMNNGTSATHALFIALKFKHPSIQKIYIPNNVFVAPWNCGLYEYDESVFEVMKMNSLTMNIDVSEEYILSLEKGAAVVIVHNLGNIVNVPRLKRLRPDLIFLEDNCEGLFGTYESKYSGSYSGSLCSSVSFYGNKTITTGEGGAFFTHDPEIYEYMKTFYSHGMSTRRYVHNILGVNYRMTNVQAAFLYDQLLGIDDILKEKSRVYDTYLKLFQEIEGVKLFKQEDNTRHSKWMFSLTLPGIKYDDLETFLLEKHIQIRPLFYDIREHEHLRGIRMAEPALDIKSGFMVPSYPELAEIQQIYIVNCIKEFYESIQRKETGK
jgi:perosamine synthetase